MTLLLKQSGETNKEALCVKLGSDQGIIREVQAGCVSWLVDLLGIRWSGSLFRGQVSSIVQHVVVHNGFACYQRAPIVGGDHPVVQKMMALPAPVKDGITRMHPSPARTATARHARMRSCVCTRTPPLDMRACAPASARACCALITCSFCPGAYVLFETAPPPRYMRACVHRHARMRA